MDKMKAKDVVIIGAGGFARELAWLIEEINKQTPTWNFLGFIEKDAKLIGQACGRWTIIGDDKFLTTYRGELSVAIGIGTPSLIARIHRELKTKANLHFPNFVFPGVICDRKRVKIGQGNIICAGNVLTTDIQIGSFNIFNISSTFGHDLLIGNYCVFSPGVHISGHVRIGNGCYFGANAVVLEKMTIGDNVTVGSGAVVTQHIPLNLTVWGIPARPLIRKEFITPVN